MRLAASGQHRGGWRRFSGELRSSSACSVSSCGGCGLLCCPCF
jgi:hypothetical protein